jgi:hypothetical protein
MGSMVICDTCILSGSTGAIWIGAITSSGGTDTAVSVSITLAARTKFASRGAVVDGRGCRGAGCGAGRAAASGRSIRGVVSGVGVAVTIAGGGLSGAGQFIVTNASSAAAVRPAAVSRGHHTTLVSPGCSSRASTRRSRPGFGSTFVSCRTVRSIASSRSCSAIGRVTRPDFSVRFMVDNPPQPASASTAVALPIRATSRCRAESRASRRSARRSTHQSRRAAAGRAACAAACRSSRGWRAAVRRPTSPPPGIATANGPFR